MKILVIGGAGYLGSVLVPKLLEKGHDVTVFDKLSWGINSLFHVAGDERVQIVKGDIMDREHLARVMAKKDAIVHLAAIVGYPACDKDPDLATKTNITGTKNITEFIEKDQILVFASTCSCYGAIDGICTETTTLNPQTLYGKTKAKGEEMVLSSEGVVLRFATLFGLSSRMRLDLLIHQLVLQAVCRKRIDIYEGLFRRSFLHVKDAALSIMFAIENVRTMSGKVYNVGDETLNFTKLQIAKLIKDTVADCSLNEINIGFDNDKRDYEVSYKKIKDLGYQSKISIQEGIHKLTCIMPLVSVEQTVKYLNV